MSALFKILLCALCAHAGAVQAQSSAEKMQQESSWIGRPWDLRYVLHVYDRVWWKNWKEMAEESNSVQGQKYFRWHSLFNAVKTFHTPQLKHEKDLDIAEGKGFSVVPIEFDKNGKVTTRNASSTPLVGRLSADMYVDLVDGEEQHRRNYALGIWFTGFGDESKHWAPTLCPVEQSPGGAWVRSDIHLYSTFFQVTPYDATFGCREWAFQLLDERRPYIDVTSYVPTDTGYSHGTYIRQFIGWARFGDKKPIIGKHQNTWYCLYDCPNGQAPGQIADIKAWASANGWKVPKRPTKSPTFVDPPAKQGTYP